MVGDIRNIKIIEHRGGWCKDLKKYQEVSQQNSYQAFCNSFNRKNGIETDIRDRDGDIVISHDMSSKKEIKFVELLSLLQMKYDSFGTLALNVKADGLQKKLREILDKYKIEDYFLFDILIPEIPIFTQYNLNFYLRQSEYEPNPKVTCCSIYRNAKGIWLDQLEESRKQISWISEKIIRTHLDENKKIAIASPELHGWGRIPPYTLYKLIWAQYKKIFRNLIKYGYNLSCIAICTDLPKEARLFFNLE